MNDNRVEAVAFGLVDKPGEEDTEFVSVRGMGLFGGGKKALWIESPESADAGGGGGGGGSGGDG